VVFGGGDDWMAALAVYRDEIPARVAHPSAEVVAAAMDKVHLARCARDVGLVAPHTEAVTDSALVEWVGPVVVKCRAHWLPGQVRPLRIEAKLFPDVSAAGTQIERIRCGGAEPVLQAPVEGRLGALIGIFHNGRLHGRVQQVASRLWPTPCGASTRAETVPVDEELAARSEHLLGALGWSGLVELQFLTGADGVPCLIDLNGRFYGSMALADTARPGLADAWGRLVLGEEMTGLPDARPGVRYVWTAGDVRRAGMERRGGLVADVADTLRWACGARESIWDPRDPGPAWYLATGSLRRRMLGGAAPGRAVPDLSEARTPAAVS
jgi:hypothetical protein